MFFLRYSMTLFLVSCPALHAGFFSRLFCREDTISNPVSEQVIQLQRQFSKNLSDEETFLNSQHSQISLLLQTAIKRAQNFPHKKKLLIKSLSKINDPLTQITEGASEKITQHGKSLNEKISNFILDLKSGKYDKHSLHSSKQSLSRKASTSSVRSTSSKYSSDFSSDEEGN